MAVVSLIETSPTFRLHEGDRRICLLGFFGEGIPLCKIQTFRDILRGRDPQQEPSLATVPCRGLESLSHTKCKD